MIVIVASLIISIAMITIALWISDHPKLTHARWKVFGGILAGGGVCIAHYSEMWSMQTKATFSYIPGITVLAILIGIISATAALIIFFHLQNLWVSNWKLIFLIANIIALTVCAMHYTAMAGVQFTLSTSITHLNAPSGAEGVQLLKVMVSLLCVPLIGIIGLQYRNYRGMQESKLKKDKLLVYLFIFNYNKAKNMKVMVDTNGDLPSKVVLFSYVWVLRDALCALCLLQQFFMTKKALIHLWI